MLYLRIQPLLCLLLYLDMFPHYPLHYLDMVAPRPWLRFEHREPELREAFGRQQFLHQGRLEVVRSAVIGLFSGNTAALYKADDGILV
ncbi:hypothetical protein AK812_SmicGene12174 [Symbiodinium microadriaticum]|uniref:Uncharacterized protein n=1 Tax=Symbiodinium microadriaticum TaxID=2951 RepID=A0A1Q9EBD7_SYMMI|nr:hypothetical protein AK812_SmicGene12174 [Symbiodinium microadriaticum]